MDASRKDSNGTFLADGDLVTLIEYLNVRNASQTLKRGMLVKNSCLTASPAGVEGRTGGHTMMLKTELLKQV